MNPFFASVGLFIVTDGVRGGRGVTLLCFRPFGIPIMESIRYISAAASHPKNAKRGSRDFPPQSVLDRYFVFSQISLPPRRFLCICKGNSRRLFLESIISLGFSRRSQIWSCSLFPFPFFKTSVHITFVQLTAYHVLVEDGGTLAPCRQSGLTQYLTHGKVPPWRAAGIWWGDLRLDIPETFGSSKPSNRLRTVSQGF